MYYSRKKRVRPTRTKQTARGNVVAYDIQPVRDLEHIAGMMRHLAAKPRDQFLFLLGINCGLRVSDLLWLRVADVKHNEHMVVREIKTGKVRRFLINEHLRPYVDKYIEGMNDYDYLFASNRYPHLPIGRVQAYRILREAGEAVGLDFVATHSMRKTFGYHYYRTRQDILTLQMIFNHARPDMTLKYIGWFQTQVDESLQDFILGVDM